MDVIPNIAEQRIKDALAMGKEPPNMVAYMTTGGTCASGTRARSGFKRDPKPSSIAIS